MAEADQANVILQVFKQWDKDGSGSISRRELKQVMTALMGRMSEEDIDVLMDEADTNRNGQIEIDEFVRWLTKPAKKSLGKAIFDYSEAFRPIFRIYDRDEKGTIDQAEFEEVHCILQGALRLNSDDSDDTRHVDPLQLKMDSDEAFKKINKNGDSSINFREFVQWMQEHIPPNMSTDELSTFCKKLALNLQHTFHVVTLAEQGKVAEHDSHVLETVLKNLAQTTREFSDALDSGASKLAASIKKAEPAFGMSVERLKGTHMKRVPVNMTRTDSVAFQVQAFPVAEGGGNWIAELVRKVSYDSGKTVEEKPTYYRFEAAAFNWLPCPDAESGKKEFDAATSCLEGEVGLLCLMQTKANFGKEATMRGILEAMAEAVEIGFIDEEQRQLWMAHIKKRLLAAHGDGTEKAPASDQLYDEHNEALLASVKVPPSTVMGIISEA